MIATSAMSGTFVIWNVPSVSSVVAISFRTEFLAPGTRDRSGERSIAADDDRVVVAGRTAGSRSTRGARVLLGLIHGPPVCSLRGARRARRQPALARRRRTSRSSSRCPATTSCSKPTTARVHSSRLEGPFSAYRRTVDRRRRRTGRDDHLRRHDPLVRLAVPGAGARGPGPEVLVPIVVGATRSARSDPGARARAVRRRVDERGVRQHALHPDRQLRRRRFRRRQHRHRDRRCVRAGRDRDRPAGGRSSPTASGGAA